MFDGRFELCPTIFFDEKKIVNMLEWIASTV